MSTPPFEELEDELMGEEEDGGFPTYLSTNEVSAPEVPSAIIQPLQQASRPDIDRESRARVVKGDRFALLRATYHDMTYQMEREKDQRRRFEQYEALVSECSRRVRFTSASHESRIDPPSDPVVAAALAHVPFDDGWVSVMKAFKVYEPEPFIKCIDADESFNAYLRSHGKESVDENLVREFLAMVLQGAHATQNVRRIIRNPPDPIEVNGKERLSYFALGQYLHAIPEIFTAMLSSQLQQLSDIRRGVLVEEDAIRLLNTAKAQVKAVLSQTCSIIQTRYPLLLTSNVGGVGSKLTTVVYECLQDALAELFEIRLSLFYRNCYETQDRQMSNYAKSLESNFSLQAMFKAFGGDESSRVLEFLKNGTIDESILVHKISDCLSNSYSPAYRLQLLAKVMELLKDAKVSGDDVVPLLAAVFLKVTANNANIQLISQLSMLEDFAQQEKDLNIGLSAYVLSSIIAAGVVLQEEVVKQKPQSTA